MVKIATCIAMDLDKKKWLQDRDITISKAIDQSLEDYIKNYKEKFSEKSYEFPGGEEGEEDKV